MMKLLRETIAVVLIGLVSVSALAQRRDQDKRPPKEPGRVVTQEKKQPPPPPKNSNRPKSDGKKKP